MAASSAMVCAAPLGPVDCYEWLHEGRKEGAKLQYVPQKRGAEKETSPELIDTDADALPPPDKKKHLVDAMDHLICTKCGEETTLATSQARGARNPWKRTCYDCKAFLISAAANILFLIHTVYSHLQVRKQNKVTELEYKLVQMRLDSLSVQELRMQATRVGYIMDSSKITKQNLVMMIMAKGDANFFSYMLSEEHLSAKGH